MGIKAIYVKRGANPFHTKFYDGTWAYLEIDSSAESAEDLRAIALDREPPGYDFVRLEGVGGETIVGDQPSAYDAMTRQDLVNLLHMKDEARVKLIEEHDSEITRLENIDHCSGCKIADEVDQLQDQVTELEDSIYDRNEVLPEPSHLAQKMLVDDTLETLRAQINDNPLG